MESSTWGQDSRSLLWWAVKKGSENAALNIEKAERIQEVFSQLAAGVSEVRREFSSVAGADVAYHGETAAAAVVLLEYPSLKLLETVSAPMEARIPYSPSFLGFREAPLIHYVVRRLSHEPDLVLVDGHGRAHPRLFGLACHVGVMLNTPTVGVAKSLLAGREVEDRVVDEEGRALGYVLKREGKRPLYVSVGYKITLDDAFRVVQGCTINSSPEPLKLAHQEANRLGATLQR